MFASQKPFDSPSEPRQTITSGTSSIAELVTVAMTFITVPGIVLYLAVIVTLLVGKISLAGNVIAPLLLASVGLVLFLLVLVGLAAGIWCVRQNKKPARIILLSLWLNGIVLASLIALVALCPPLQ